MKHMLPLLLYDKSALEPYIDERTMTLHHDVHHASYVDALNIALESAPELLQEKKADWLLFNLDKVPENIRTEVSHNAGGHVNHCLLWRIMYPQTASVPQGQLAAAINASFGSFEKFKLRFEDAGSHLFGSGWVWLVKAQNNSNKLTILTTTGHDNPLTQGYTPILVNDVWEHAYYLKHESRRMEYLHNWWPVVNWDEVAELFEESGDIVELSSEGTNANGQKFE